MTKDEQHVLKHAIQRAIEVGEKLDKLDQYEGAVQQGYYEVLNILKNDLSAAGVSLRDYGLDTNLDNRLL